MTKRRLALFLTLPLASLFLGCESGDTPKSPTNPATATKGEAGSTPPPTTPPAGANKTTKQAGKGAVTAD